MKQKHLLLFLSLLLFAALILQLGPNTATAATPIQLFQEEPTLHCLGVRWLIEESDLEQISIQVAYHEQGSTQWRETLPLFRVEPEAMEEHEPPLGQALYAGSLCNLEPATEYTIRLRLMVDEVEAHETTFTQATRAEPVAPPPLRTLHVVPGDGGGSGTEQDPFRGFAAADDASRLGDLFLLHQGLYTGPVLLTQDGTAENPIIWRAAGDGEVVIEDPAGGFGIRVYGRSHVWLEGLTIRNLTYGIRAMGASDLVIRHCRLENVPRGIFGDSTGQARFFISDNVLDGGVVFDNNPAEGEYRAIELAGVGHVIAYNRIHHYKDCVNTRPPYPIRAIDIHNNDISECRDDGIELDFSEHNVRAYRNRLTNISMGISFQPSRGGPNYAMYNAMYNVGHESFKLHLTPTNSGSDDWRLGPHRTSGGVLFHNTVVKNNVAFRVWSGEGPAHYFTAKNNLMIGLPAQYAIELTPLPMRYADFDFNGWAATSSFADFNGTRYDTLAEFQAGTGLENNSHVFSDESALFQSTLIVPEGRWTRYPIANNNLVLKSGSQAENKGVYLPGINDGYTGSAPDLGAYEQGAAAPHYGPRGVESRVPNPPQHLRIE